MRHPMSSDTRGTGNTYNMQGSRMGQEPLDLLSAVFFTSNLLGTGIDLTMGSSLERALAIISVIEIIWKGYNQEI